MPAVEGPNPRDPGQAMGRTRHNKLAFFPGDGQALKGRLVQVRWPCRSGGVGALAVAAHRRSSWWVQVGAGPVGQVHPRRMQLLAGCGGWCRRDGRTERTYAARWPTCALP